MSRLGVDEAGKSNAAKEMGKKSALYLRLPALALEVRHELARQQAAGSSKPICKQASCLKCAQSLACEYCNKCCANLANDCSVHRRKK